MVLSIDSFPELSFVELETARFYTRGEYIGTDDTHNVYVAELTAIQMAVELFKEKIDKHTKTYIFTDNQSAIQAIESPKRQSG